MQYYNIYMNKYNIYRHEYVSIGFDLHQLQVKIQCVIDNYKGRQLDYKNTTLVEGGWKF